MGDYLGAWKDLEKAYAAKKVRAIGICNVDYFPEQLEKFVSAVTMKPQIIQIECHPYQQQFGVREVAKKYDIKVECWYPFGGRPSKGVLFRDPVITAIAASHKKSAAQIILRFQIQEGLATLPSSTSAEHILSNLSVFDFSLSEDEIKQLRALDKNEKFYTVPYETGCAEYPKYVPAE